MLTEYFFYNRTLNRSQCYSLSIEGKYLKPDEDFGKDPSKSIIKFIQKLLPT